MLRIEACWRELLWRLFARTCWTSSPEGQDDFVLMISFFLFWLRCSMQPPWSSYDLHNLVSQEKQQLFLVRPSLSLSVSLRMSTQLWFSVPEICTSNSAWHFPPSPVMKDCTTQACNWGLAFRPAISTMFWIPKWARKLAPSQQHSSKCLFKWTCFPIAILYTTNIVPLKSKNRNAWSFCTNDTSRTKQVFEEWHTKTCAHNTT